MHDAFHPESSKAYSHVGTAITAAIFYIGRAYSNFNDGYFLCDRQKPAQTNIQYWKCYFWWCVYAFTFAALDITSQNAHERPGQPVYSPFIS